MIQLSWFEYLTLFILLSFWLLTTLHNAKERAKEIKKLQEKIKTLRSEC